MFADASLPWRPFYLRRRVLASFVLIFVLMLVAIEVLVVVSNRNDGLATSNPGQHYLWTYGPTAFLTLVAAAWARAEYQSKMVAPWIRLSQRDADVRRTLMLDYVSQFQLFAVYSSLRNGDFVVATTVLVSVLIKILIVISTGLITLSLLGVNTPSHPMMVRDAFVADAARLANIGTLSYHMMRGLAGKNLTYLEGFSDEFAYQSVQTNLPPTAETTVVVDALSASLDCRPATMGLLGSKPRDPRETESVMNITVTSPGCDIKRLRLTSPGRTSGRANSSVTLFTRFAPVSCDGNGEGIDDDSKNRIIIIFGKMNYTIDFSRNTTTYNGHQTNPLIAKMEQSTQLICTPGYSLGQVEVVRNSTRTKSVARLPGPWDSTLSGVSGWAMADALFKSHDNGLESVGVTWGSQVNISMDIIDVDASMHSAILLWLQHAPDTKASALFDSDTLRQVASRFYRQHGAIVAKQALLKPAEVPITGAAIVNQNRLVVRSWAAQWMAGLVAACLLLAAVSMFLVPRRGVLPRNPSTITGTASLVQNSDALLARLRDSGAADERTLSGVFDGSQFRSGVGSGVATHPGQFVVLGSHQHSGAAVPTPARAAHTHPSVLHPASRLALCVVLVAIIIALELMLRKSTSEDGLGDVGDDDTYLHYTWTTVPAVVLGIVTMVFAAMDFNVRALVPYTTLKETVGTAAFVRIDLLDMSLPRAIYREVRLANLGAFATTLTLLIGSLFTIFSGSLFQALTIPSESSIVLRANRSFPIEFRGTSSSNAASVVSLILSSNYSYPKFTYDDLVFPELVLDTSLASISGPKSTESMSLKAVIPAVRSKLNCRLLDASKIRVNHTVDYKDTFGHSNPLGIWMDGEECNLKPAHEVTRYNLVLDTWPNETYWGQSELVTPRGCSRMFYTWGSFENTPGGQVIKNIAAMGCNLTLEIVDVDTTYLGGDLVVDQDPEHAPRPLENTVRASNVFTPGKDGVFHPETFSYMDLGAVGTAPDLLDEFFSLLISSQWAIPMAHLGDATKNEEVANAIKHQHGIIQSQQFADFRTNQINLTSSISAGAGPADTILQMRYNATVTDATGRRRVVQDAASTRVLEALLIASLVLIGLAWWFTRRSDVLSRKPTTIASVAALLAGGNVLDLLPPDAARKNDGELAHALGTRTRFWMGWGSVPDREGGTKDVKDEGGSNRFGIFAIQDGMVVEQQTTYRGVGTHAPEAQELFQGDDRPHHRHISSGWRGARPVTGDSEG